MQERLEFFPGEKRLLYLVDGKRKLEVEAWGGPEHQLPRSPGEPFGAGPTDPGRYVIWTTGPYVTPTWPWSRVPWGSRLRESTQDPGDVLYEAGHGKWMSVRRLTGMKKAQIARAYHQLYGRWRVPETWVFNDFGPLAIRYFRDRNGDGVLDGHEHLSGEMFHTTPDNEAQDALYRAAHPGAVDEPPVQLFESHGCIHLRPADRARMMGAGGFRRGMRLVIHTYRERFSE